jgi:anaerobic selenocysteine-containing dehydrogenase
MEEFITACPRNCYSTCTFRVRLKDKQISGVLPYPGNLATPEGPCIKGLSYIERAHSPERIVYPLKNEPGKGFVRITTREAFDIIHERLSSIRHRYSPHSILWYRGSGMSGLTNEIGAEFWKEFGGTTTTYGNLCWPAGLEAVSLTLGSVKHNVPWDLVNARTIILWGKNPAETNIQEIRFIAEAKARGCRVIVIDPVRTPTADKADLLYCPIPGTDAALALAIARILIGNDLIDKDFINQHVSGFDEFRRSLTITPSMAAEITGIPVEGIHRLATIIGDGAPLTIIPGYGLQRHTNGGQTIRSILALSILTGNIGKPGAGFNYANLQSYIYDDPKEPLSYYPDIKKDKPFRRTISMARLGTTMLAMRNPEIRGIWVERGNPLLQAPDSVNVRKAFSKAEFIVVNDQFMTDTASMADVILPAKNMFEQSDIIGSYWSPYIQFKPKILDPPGDVMPESEIYFHLAGKFGFDPGKKRIPEPGNQNIEDWLSRRIEGYPGITLDDLRNGPVIPPGTQEIAFSDHVFGTPSGKIELLSEQAAAKWGVPVLPGYTPAEKNPGYPLAFITPNPGSRIHSQFGNLDIIRETVGEAATLVSPADASARNIRSGDRIRIYNDTGNVISQARISARVPSGIVILPNGIWLNEGGGGNLLIEARETDMGYGAAFHDSRVEIERTDL